MKENIIPEIQLPSTKALLDSIEHSGLTDVLKDVGEITIDSLVSESVFRDIPIIGWISGLYKTGSSVRNALFTRKIIAFLVKVSELTLEERQQALESLKSESSLDDIGEILISYTDRSETASKASILGALFNQLGLGNITASEYWAMITVVDRMPIQDLRQLPKYLPVANSRKSDKRLNYLCLSSGLGRLEPMVGRGLAFIYDERLFEILCGVFEES